MCHPSDTSLPDCCRRAGVWAEPVGALLGYDVKPAGVEAIISRAAHREAYRQYRASLGKLVAAQIQAVEGITRTLTCPVVHI